MYTSTIFLKKYGNTYQGIRDNTAIMIDILSSRYLRNTWSTMANERIRENKTSAGSCSIFADHVEHNGKYVDIGKPCPSSFQFFLRSSRTSTTTAKTWSANTVSNSCSMGAKFIGFSFSGKTARTTTSHG